MKKTPDYVKNAASVVPSERQIKWQQTEFYAFVHFGMNTFTDSEWGSGNESPSLFNPSKLDCRQWAKLFMLSGMKAMILTAKHHDGFCLWPSEYTDHSVKSSPWRNGRGDVVADCAAACKEFGLKFGIYVSPWDRHEESYGSGKDYDDYFVNQLTELCSDYGELFCVWFDGACGEGKDGKKQNYDWLRYYDVIRSLQPNATINICGPDVRWCGNEVGVCRKSEWSVVPYYYSDFELIKKENQIKSFHIPKNTSKMALDIGSRKRIKKCPELIWYPAEVDVSVRKGWFYHESDKYSVKPLNKIMDIYYNSVGSNACLLLNVPPNKEGKISSEDTDLLLSVGAQLDIEFNENLALGSTLTCDRCLDKEHDSQNIIDNPGDNYWHSGYDPDGSTLLLDLGDEYDIDKIVLGEHIRSGQQIERFTLYVKTGNKWNKLYNGTVIGYKKIIRFKEVRARYFKLVINKSRCFATLEKFEAY
ncbi:MAG: alpha-L-fucosidase [Clostridiales bacterium]|nr:alpha-L-fucosidase [Clostridiales bacterium]